MSWAKCSECGETFTGDKWFDRHKVNMSGKPGYDPEYDWRCSTPDEMTAKGWIKAAKGWWQGYLEGPFRLTGCAQEPRDDPRPP